MRNQQAQHKFSFDSKGYTMIETLFVLTIFTLSTSIFIFSVFPLQSHLNETHFVQQLEKDLQLAKIHAMSNFKSVRVIFNPQERKYLIITGIDQILVDRKFDEEIEIINSTFKQFYYLPNGNVSDFGTFYMIIGNETYKFVMHVGRGRVSIEKV